MKNLIPLLILNSVLLVGCKTGQNLRLEPEPYLKWYSSDKNFFRSADTVNEVCYSFVAYPKEVSIAICAMNKCEEKEILLTDLKSKSTTCTYLFELKSLNSQKDLFDMSTRQMGKDDKILYLSNGIKNDLKALSSKGDTLKCISAIYEPLLPNKFRLIIDFESPGFGSIDHIVYTDQLITQSQMKFDFSQTTHSNFPLLNLANYEK